MNRFNNGWQSRGREPATKCPATFAKSQKGNGSVNPLKDCIKMIAEYMSK